MEARVLDLLSALGDEPDAIAASLEGLGIQGYRLDSKSCPLVNYLRRYGITSVVMHDRLVVAGLDEAILCPAKVKDFLRKFDLGLYPKLMLERA